MFQKIFSVDNSFMRALSRITDSTILNVLFLVCSIPIITLGASCTALYFMTLKVVDCNRTSFADSADRFDECTICGNGILFGNFEVSASDSVSHIWFFHTGILPVVCFP